MIIDVEIHLLATIFWAFFCLTTVKMASKKPDSVEKFNMHVKCAISHFSAQCRLKFYSSSRIWLI